MPSTDSQAVSEMPVCRAKTPIRMITATSKNQTTMKRLFNSIMAVATIAAAITACTKEDVSNIGTPAEFKIAVTAEADATRTYYDEAQKQMNWNASGEKLKVLEYNKSEWNFKAYTTSGYELDGRSAKFSVSVYGSASSEGFMYSAIYPAANYIEFSNSNRKAFKIQVPSAQTPAESSFDPNADLLLAKPIDLAERPSELTFQFHRVAALAKMTLKGIAAGEKIEKIELAASQPLAGVLVADLSTGKLTDAAVADGKGLTLTINDFVATGEDAIWFTALPCTLGADDTLTITVDTDKATYEKTAVFTADKPFALESADITAFGVTEMKRSEKAQAKTYTKLTDVSLLNAEDEILFVYFNEQTAANYTFSTVMDSYDCITVQTVTITNSQITVLPEKAQVITLHDGEKDGTFKFELKDGTYLNAARAKFAIAQSIDNAHSWQISISKYGLITVKSINDETGTPYIKYNEAKGDEFFQCVNTYSGQPLTAIYHCAIGTPKTALAAPTDLAATAAGNVVTVTWGAVEGAADYTVTCGGESKTTAETTAEFTLEYDKSYEISVVANPADTSIHKVSATATASVTTEKEPVVEPSSDFVELTDASTLKVGDELIFVYDWQGVCAAGKEFGYDGPKSVSVSIVDGKIASPADNVLIATLCEGAAAGQFLLKTEDKYINADGYSLELTSSASTAHSWTITNGSLKTSAGNYFVFETMEIGGFCSSSYLGSGAYSPTIYVRSAAGEVSGDDKEETLVFPVDGATSGRIGTIEGKNFTLSSSNAEWHSDGLGIKMSSSNSITFKPANGKTITKIEITAANGKYFKARADEGSLDNNQSAGATSVWTGSAAVSVTFTATGFSIIGQVKVTCE